MSASDETRVFLKQRVDFGLSLDWTSRASSLTQLAGRATLPCPSIYAALFFLEPHCKTIYRLVHW